MTERFSRAIEHLGYKDSVDVRIGGIYSLEQIMSDVPDQQPPVVEILASFVRNHAPRRSEPVAVGGAERATIAADVQVALTVIARRDPAHDAPNRRVDLRDTKLDGVDLGDANLPRVNLSGADLRSAQFVRANLQDALLGGADLRWSSLDHADLRGARFYNAQLDHAQLYRANARGARMSGALGVSSGQLNCAWIGDTELPAALEGHISDSVGPPDCPHFEDE